MTAREVAAMTLTDVQEMAEQIRAATGAPRVEIVIGDDESAMKIIAKAVLPPTPTEGKE